MGKPSAPKPPDPKETAGAQTATNIGTAIANNTMGMVDQVTPYGNLTNTISGYIDWTDPNTGQTHKIPKYTSTTTLSGAQQGILDQNNITQKNLAETGASQSAFLKDYLGTPFTPDTAAVEGRLAELGRSRIDPMMAERRASTETQLANKGIAPGSEAYNRAMGLVGQQENDAYNELFLKGRGQATSEAYAQRNQPLNEIASLLSGSQVTQPNVQMAAPQGAATTDYAGLVNANYQQKQQNYQQRSAAQQGLLGGLFGLGSSLIMSDRRLKTDIKRVGETEDGVPIYTYRYKGDPKVHMGVMAQELEKTQPEAVEKVGKFKAVNYAEVN